MSPSLLDGLEPLTAYSNIKSICYKTVDTFSGITGKRLWLSDGQYAHTDGKKIVVPFDDSNVYILLEHEISHILFKSDVYAKNAFVAEYSKKITKLLEDAKAEKPPHIKSIAGVINFILNIIEDHRCDDLWGKIYPGSFQRKKAFDAKLTTSFIHHAHYSLLVYFLCVESKISIPSGKNSVFKPIFEEALKKVEGRGFRATLVVAKWLITLLVNEIIYESPEEDKDNPGNNPTHRDIVQAMEKRIHALCQLVDQAHVEIVKEKYPSYAAPLPSFEDWKEKLAGEALAEKVIKSNITDEVKMEAYLQHSAKEMEKIIQDTQQSLQKNMSLDEWLQKDAKARVVFRDIYASDILQEEKVDQENETETIRKLQGVFTKIRGQVKIMREYSGTELDVTAYIESRITQIPSPCFAHEERGRGFKALILLDRSSSMRGKKTRQAEKACRIVSKAMKYPFVQFQTWGFQSSDAGQVDISRFIGDFVSFNSRKSAVSGTTPLHLAIRLATKSLEIGSESKQLFLITDGEPIYFNKNSLRSNSSQLIQFTRDAVHQAQKKGINLTVIMIDPKISIKLMYYMFGSSKNWRIVEQETFSNDLIRLVTSSFISYLKDI